MRKLVPLLLACLFAAAASCDQDDKCLIVLPNRGGTSSGGAAPVLSTAIGGTSTASAGAAGSGATDAGTPASGAAGIAASWPTNISSTDLGSGYRFVDTAAGNRQLIIAAEGDGPPVVVSAYGCESVELATLPAAYTGWHVRDLSIAWADAPLLFACGANTCALFDGLDADTTFELRQVPGSETPTADWNVAGTLAISESLPCFDSITSRMCFAAGGWTVDTPAAQRIRTHEFAPPACEDLELVLYAAEFASKYVGTGVTADGRVVRVDNSPTATRRCTAVSESHGQPLSFFEFGCGISSNLWLVTAERLLLGANGSSCECNID